MGGGEESWVVVVRVCVSRCWEECKCVGGAWVCAVYALGVGQQDPGAEQVRAALWGDGRHWVGRRNGSPVTFHRHIMHSTPTGAWWGAAAMGQSAACPHCCTLGTCRLARGV